MEKGERISLKASCSSLAVASGKSIMSGCAYGWVETGTPFRSRFMFSKYDKYFHTLCNTVDAMIECMCLWLSFTVFEQLLQILNCFCKLLYIYMALDLPQYSHKRVMECESVGESR
jgi:hypothetical protein